MLNIYLQAQAKCSQKEMESYAVAGGIAEEVLSAIRTVIAFGGEAKEAERYEKNLYPAMKSGIKRNFYTGLGAGVLWGCIYGGFALGIWYGVKLLLEDHGYTVGGMVIIFWNVIGCGMSITFAVPHFEAFQTAKGAAVNVFDVIERESQLDPLVETGEKTKNLTSSIKFVDLHFCYPTRPDVKILNGFNLEIKPGETIALVSHFLTFR